MSNYIIYIYNNIRIYHIYYTIYVICGKFCILMVLWATFGNNWYDREWQSLIMIVDDHRRLQGLLTITIDHHGSCSWIVIVMHQAWSWLINMHDRHHNEFLYRGSHRPSVCPIWIIIQMSLSFLECERKTKNTTVVIQKR